MNAQLILSFLQNIATNNNREWFLSHKPQYLQARAEFERGVENAIRRIGAFDTSIAHLKPADCCFRFYRDVRFSQDKSPYKRHFGAYISAHGKKSLHAGYYLHMEPGHCLLSAGAYWLPTKILTACRNEIMANTDQWRAVVENGAFIHHFGYPGEGHWENEGEMSDKGFGLSSLKKCPTGFPADYPYIQYLRLKDYAVWIRVPDDYFASARWTENMAQVFEIAKPMMDFMNDVIDDYE